MQLFSCVCESVVFFENTECIDCRRTLGFDPFELRMLGLDSVSPAELSSPHSGKRYAKCANWVDYDACNWLVPQGNNSRYCEACRLNEIVPDLQNSEHLELWKRMEAAKRRLLYTLLSLGLRVTAKTDDPNGLAFRFLADSRLGRQPEGKSVTTGHARGVITINLAEADDIERAQAQERLGEAYRTLLGHFRHESGHYYWDQLVRNSPRLEQVREVFGDERADYKLALQQNYATGPAEGYEERYVSAYAASHPWEDWAETWAHYLHLIDSLETAHSFGIKTHVHARKLVEPEPGVLSSDAQGFAGVLQSWIWLSLAMNSLNRSMGMRDSYPFVLSAAVIRKLELVHQVVTTASQNQGQTWR